MQRRFLASMKTRPSCAKNIPKSGSVESLSDPIRDPNIICPFSIPSAMVAVEHPIPSIVENVFHDAISSEHGLMHRRSRPHKMQRPAWGNPPNYKDVWKTSLSRRDGPRHHHPQRVHASLPPRARPSPPMSPLLAPASSSLYDEFYPWRGEDFADAYWEGVFLGDCLDDEKEDLVDYAWTHGFEAGMSLFNIKREYPDSMPLPTKTTPTFNEDFEYLYVTDMRSTMGKHCALIFTDSVSWLSKKRCPKRCRVYVIPGVHLAINDLFKHEFEWTQIAVSEMWHTRQNNCKEICHRHKHNSSHIIRNLIISKSPIPEMI
jgi:hypothetical protein